MDLQIALLILELNELSHLLAGVRHARLDAQKLVEYESDGHGERSRDEHDELDDDQSFRGQNEAVSIEDGLWHDLSDQAQRKRGQYESLPAWVDQVVQKHGDKWIGGDIGQEQCGQNAIAVFANRQQMFGVDLFGRDVE